MADLVEVTVPVRPECDIHRHELMVGAPAFYDGKTVMGPWAYMCETCFATYGVGLGMGRGQRLIAEDERCPGCRNGDGCYGDEDTPCVGG